MDLFLDILKWSAIAIGTVGGLAVVGTLVFLGLLYNDWSKNGFH